MSDTPSFFDGLIGIIREPYYMLTKPRKICEHCSQSWGGYYANQMEYCHFCGRELTESGPLIDI